MAVTTAGVSGTAMIRPNVYRAVGRRKKVFSVVMAEKDRYWRYSLGSPTRLSFPLSSFFSFLP